MKAIAILLATMVVSLSAHAGGSRYEWRSSDSKEESKFEVKGPTYCPPISYS